MDRVVQIDGVEGGTEGTGGVVVEKVLILRIIEGNDSEKVCFIIVPVPGLSHKTLQHRQVGKVKLFTIPTNLRHIMGTIIAHLLVIGGH